MQTDKQTHIRTVTLNDCNDTNRLFLVMKKNYVGENSRIECQVKFIGAKIVKLVAVKFIWLCFNLFGCFLANLLLNESK